MVEWKKLGEISEIGTGSNNREDATDNGRYPFYVRSKDVLKIDSYLFDEEAILIPGEGGIGDIFHYINGKYGLHQRAYRVHPITGNAKGRYIYYYLFANFKAYINTKSYKSTAASIRRPMLLDFPIAIPSLSEQERIVSILDTFTASIDNIKAQIEQRRKQYEHYRNTLLTFNKDDDSVEWKTLEDIFELRNGYTPSKANSEFWTDGTIPWFRMEDIRDKGRILSDSYLHITESAIKGKGLFKANSFILATTATIGEHALLIADSLANQQFTNLKIRKSLINNIDIKFMFYYMFVVDEFCKSHTNVSGFASVDMNALKRMAIPIPSLARQQEIVSILDTFEASITNLEAQLEQRQKQYEYYREKLLTFE